MFSWMCWIRPDDVVINQLFGVNTGLGMGLLTFYWAQISWISNPLVTPWWAQLNFFAGFVFIYWILVPIFYYTNVSQARSPSRFTELNCGCRLGISRISHSIAAPRLTGSESNTTFLGFSRLGTHSTLPGTRSTLLCTCRQHLLSRTSSPLLYQVVSSFIPFFTTGGQSSVSSLGGRRRKMTFMRNSCRYTQKSLLGSTSVLAYWAPRSQRLRHKFGIRVPRSG